MNKFLCGLFLCLAIFPTFGQKTRIIDNKAIQFEITQNNDSINFIVVDTVLTQKKPVFLWCQGSHAYPLFEKNPSLISWKSFSEPQIDELVKIDIPIYLVYTELPMLRVIFVI